MINEEFLPKAKHGFQPEAEPVPIYVHLDLKGAPPKRSYLRNLWPILKKWHVTGILLEWEDCFPYSGALQCLSNNTYTYDEAQLIVNDIREQQMEVIPLIQTFGHLEFVLKHDAFVGLREVPIYLSSMCPSHPNAQSVIMSILEQVIPFHGNFSKFHIGADEVWHMGICDRCKARVAAGESKEDLFLKHVHAILKFIKMKWPHLTVIMWDDMLRPMDESVILAYNLHSLVQPMVWHYNCEEAFSLPPDIWSKFSSFSGVWAAGVFKGASGSLQLVPPATKHAGNALHWARCLHLFKTPCKGFVLTGWSRYDHFATVCETLPCSLLSLGTCARTFRQGSFNGELMTSVEVDLKLPELQALAKSPSEVDRTLFVSWQILFLVTRLMTLRQSSQNILGCEQLQTWMNEWQVANRRVNPMQVVPLLPALQNTVDDFNGIEKALRENFQDVFQPEDIEEWIQTNIYILGTKMKSILHTAQTIIATATKSAEDLLKIADMDIQ